MVFSEYWNWKKVFANSGVRSHLVGVELVQFRAVISVRHWLNRP